MRTHKTVKEIKERYNYKLDGISQEDMDNIIHEIMESLKMGTVCVPIVDLINKLGFTVYNFPFSKEVVDKEVEIKGFLGIGVDFSIHENSSFILVEKESPEKMKRFVMAYLLSHYFIHIHDLTTDLYHFTYDINDLKNDIDTRFALSLLMPKDIFLAQIEFLKTAYEVSGKNLTEDELIEKLANTFRVTTHMVKARIILLKKDCNE